MHCRDGSLQRTGLARYTLVWGKLHKSEIDFVVERDGRRCYVQVAYVMVSEATIDREFGALEAIGDSYLRGLDGSCCREQEWYHSCEAHRLPA